MNDFFFAKNAHLKVEFDPTIEVHQIKVRDFDVWVPCAEPVRDFLKKNYSDEIIADLLSGHLNECLGMLELVLNKDDEYIKSLVDHPFELFLLTKASIQANQAYFDSYEKPQKSKRAVVEESKATWFDNFQILIKAGHSHESIINMNYGMFMGYIEAVKRQHKNHIYGTASYMRIAYHADKNGFEKFGNEITKD